MIKYIILNKYIQNRIWEGHKIMKKRLVSLLLSVCLVFGVMPIASFGINPSWDGSWSYLKDGNIGINHGSGHYEIKVDDIPNGEYAYGTISESGISLTGTGETLPPNNWNWAVTGKDNETRLILNNANISTSAETGNNVDTLMFKCDLILELRGNNTLNNYNNDVSVLSGFNDKSLTIEGDGTLNLIGSEQSICVNNGGLIVKSGTIKANGINVYNYYGYINGITIDGGKINVDTIFATYTAPQINVNGRSVQTCRFRCISESNPDVYSVHDKSLICY